MRVLCPLCIGHDFMARRASLSCLHARHLGECLLARDLPRHDHDRYPCALRPDRPTRRIVWSMLRFVGPTCAKKDSDFELTRAGTEALEDVPQLGSNQVALTEREKILSWRTRYAISVLSNRLGRFCRFNALLEILRKILTYDDQTTGFEPRILVNSPLSRPFRRDRIHMH
jgi:hypothetical protein